MVSVPLVAALVLHRARVEHYGAIAMPSARAVRGGVGDGAIFNANPAVDTITAILYHNKLQAAAKKPGQIGVEDYATDLVPNVLSGLHMLSLGDGAAQPNYWLRNFNFGPLPFVTLPSNPFPGPYFSRFSPQGFSLNQPIQDAALQARALLDNRYHRMNPGIMPIPPGPLVYPVRSNVLRPYIIQAIQQSVQTPPSNAARQASVTYLQNGWIDTLPPDPIL